MNKHLICNVIHYEFYLWFHLQKHVRTKKHIICSTRIVSLCTEYTSTSMYWIYCYCRQIGCVSIFLRSVSDYFLYFVFIILQIIEYYCKDKKIARNYSTLYFEISLSNAAFGKCTFVQFNVLNTNIITINMNSYKQCSWCAYYTLRVTSSLCFKVCKLQIYKF